MNNLVKKETNKKKGAGRPSSFKEIYCAQAFNYCLLGATDEDLARFFDVQKSTINNWKKEYPEFMDSLKNGKDIADAEIASSLFNRAKGSIVTVQQAFKVKDISYNSEGKRCESERIEVVSLQQELPPDTTAAIFWLKNRRPDRWRDKSNVSELTSNSLKIEVVDPDVAKELKKLSE